VTAYIIRNNSYITYKYVSLLMNKLLLSIISTLVILAIVISCKKHDGNFAPYVDIEVNMDLTKVPYDKLSEYNFFIGEIKNQSPAKKVIGYEPVSSLFTDYALKKRFVWMPDGTISTYQSDGEILNLPVGAALIKTFYYDNVQPSGETRIIETRVMIRKASGWIFAEYVWNSQQTEAYLDMSGSYTSISWDQDGTIKSSNYRIPSSTECLVCHKLNDKPIPIGIKPQSLNYRLPGEEKTQLQRWISVGYLENNIPGNIVSAIDYHDASKSIDMRLRSYLDVNCAHCHQEGKHCDYRPLRLAFSETSDPANMGLCVEPDEVINTTLINIITPANKDRSVMHYRLMSTDENVRMPLLGRSIVHDEGLQLLEDWINWKTTCN
jgi:uncharacterized repeat protein (TIGR03806 family)